jgi:hypothetical protein
MPRATETAFVERADMLDTKVGSEKKMDPAEVAKQDFDAMMAGDGDVVTGWQNKLQATISHILPAGVVPNGTGKWLRRGSQKMTAWLTGCSMVARRGSSPILITTRGRIVSDLSPRCAP